MGTGEARAARCAVERDDRGNAAGCAAAYECMGKRLYCGNLPFSATADEVRAIFAEDGRTVTDVHVVTDRETGRSRGFAFVELGTDEEAAAALQAVDGRVFGGRPLAVKEARERAPRPGGFAGPRGPRPGGRPGPGFGGPRAPQVERRPAFGDRGGYGRPAPRGGYGPGPDYVPAPMPGPDWNTDPVDFAEMPEGGYPPPEDVDYRERGDRGKRGRDRRGGRRRGGDDFDYGDDW